MYGFVGNNAFAAYDFLGLMEPSQSNAEAAPKLEKCVILIYGNHATNHDDAPVGTVTDLKNRNFKSAPKCSRIGYVGCVANYVNSHVPPEHTAGIAPVDEVPLDAGEQKSLMLLGLTKSDLAMAGAQEH